MLPLDETPFAINANTRVISNPRITVMQNDQNSEIVMFTIDRYFDYKDLDTAYIYVQWTLPDGTEGASNIEMKDLSIPGKIRFGWPLDSEITSQKGIVKFSVRFWNMDKIKDKDGKEIDTVVYSFNTQTSSLTITESLQPQLNQECDVNSPVAEGFFKKAIINSQLHNQNIAIPLNPRFDEPGLNLNAYESLSTVAIGDTPADTLTLMAQAINSDTGVLNYEWWYKPAENSDDGVFLSNTWYPFNKIEGEDIPNFAIYGGIVDNNVYKEVVLKDDQLVIGENYYVKNGSDYVAYDGSLPRPVLYERFTTYTVPAAPAKVTGQYKVIATNTIQSNTSSGVSSRICQLVSPDAIEFTKNGNLGMSAYLEEDGQTLSVSLVRDDSIAAKRKYTWTRKSGDKDLPVVDETIVVDGAQDGNSLKVTEPGWYQVQIDSTLNRETKSVKSAVCKVTNDALAPQKKNVELDQILTMDYGSEAKQQPVDAESGIPTYLVGTGDIVTLDVVTQLTPPAGYDEELFSEALIYSWGRQRADDTFVYLTEKDMGENGVVVEGLNTPTLKVRCVENGVTYTYKCIITNVLNGQNASCSLNDALAFAVS